MNSTNALFLLAASNKVPSEHKKADLIGYSFLHI